MTSTSAAPDHANVIALPPFIYLGALLLGIGAKWLLGGAIAPTSTGRLWIGVGLIIAGAGLEIWFARTLKRAGQDPNPNTTTPNIINDGPFRYSRNPAYVGLTALLSGLGLALDNPWILLSLVPTLCLMHYGVILREERYLERKFGDEYTSYKASVRRWL